MDSNAVRVFHLEQDSVELKKETLNFLSSYCFKLYPKRLQAFSLLLRESISTFSEAVAKGTFKHSVSHYVNADNERYYFEEIFASTGDKGLSISILPTTVELRDKIAKAQEMTEGTVSVASVVSYLEDALENDLEWLLETTGARPCPVATMQELIELLKNSKHLLRVLEFGFNKLQTGPELMIKLVSSGVVKYYVDISWKYQ